VDLEAAVVVNEAQLLEFLHEEIDPFARYPDHFRQSFLINFRKDFLVFALLTIMGQQQESPGQAFLAGIEKLIDQEPSCGLATSSCRPLDPSWELALGQKKEVGTYPRCPKFRRCSDMSDSVTPWTLTSHVVGP